MPQPKKLKSIRNEDGSISVVEVPLTPEEIAEKNQGEAEWAAAAGERAAADARQRRASSMPLTGDQLDAILKHLNLKQMQAGQVRNQVRSLSIATSTKDALEAILDLFNLPSELDAIIQEWIRVKAENPIPGEV